MAHKEHKKHRDTARKSVRHKDGPTTPFLPTEWRLQKFLSVYEAPIPNLHEARQNQSSCRVKMATLIGRQR